jgi:uncharacterized membrane protein
VSTHDGAAVDAAGTGADPAPLSAPGRVPAPAMLVRALAIGLATGARSMSAAAALVVTAVPTDPAPLHRAVSTPARVAACAAAAGELVVDKLPAAPPRSDPPALVARLLLAPVAAVAADRRDGAGPDRWTAVNALVATAAAGAAAVGGVRLRAALARRFGTDLPGALAEDALAVASAWVGSRRAPGPRATPGA